MHYTEDRILIEREGTTTTRVNFKELPACHERYIFNSQRISYLCENHLSEYQKHLVTRGEHKTQRVEVLNCSN